MRNNIIKLFVWLVLISNVSQAQDSCRVLLKNLQGLYSGKCKKGLAHGMGYASGVDSYIGVFKKGYPDGKGRYMWSNGDIYEGIWKKGKRTGLGKLTHFENGTEIVQDGIWLNEEYKGPSKIVPKILRQTDVSSVDIVRLGDGNTLYFKAKQNSMVQTVRYESIDGTSGSNFFSGSVAGRENIDFPFKCKLKFYYLNTCLTKVICATIEFEISEPGTYEVRITNL